MLLSPWFFIIWSHVVAFPEDKSSSFLLLLISISVLLFFSSCSSRKVLVLSDPGFDSFAEQSMGFYNLRRELLFRINGYNPEFVPYDPDESYEEQVEILIESGHYKAVVTGVAPAVRVDIPEGVKSILIGGSSELGVSFSGQVNSTSDQALQEAGQYMKKRYLEDGLLPLAVIYNYGNDAVSTLLSGWGPEEPDLIKDNILEIDGWSEELRDILDDYFGEYDFDSEGYLLLAYCAPVMRELLNSLALTGNPGLILEIPDDSLFSNKPEALIVHDYKGLLRTAAAMLKSDEGPELQKVADLFLKY